MTQMMPATSAAFACLCVASVALLLRHRRRRLPLLSLDEIGIHYSTPPANAVDKYTGGDKTSLGQGFLGFYESFLLSKRHAKDVQVLEIGVWYGKSLAMWCDYFDSCTVHGVDINLKRWNAHKGQLKQLGAFSRNRVVVHEYDTGSPEFAAFSESLPPLDLVVDDGCHTARSQYNLFRLLFRGLRSGGAYVVEDLEQPAAIFWLHGAGSQGLFAAVIAAIGNEGVLSSSEVQREAELQILEEERRLQSAREKLAKQITELQGRIAPRSAADGKAQAALAAKQAEFKAMPTSLSKGEKRRLRERFMAEMEEAAALARAAVSVELRRNALVFHRR